MPDQPIFDPSGTVRMIPDAQVQDALDAGGKRALRMLDPKGVQRWIPAESLPDALKAGGKLMQTQVEAPPFNPKVPAPPALSANEQAKGFAGAMYSKMGEFAKNLPLMTPPGQAYSDIKNFVAQLRGQAPKTQTPLQSVAGTLGIDTQAVKNAAQGGSVDLPSLAAETAFPIAQNLLMARAGSKAVPRQSLAAEGSPTALNKLAYAADVSSGKLNFPQVLGAGMKDMAIGAKRLPARTAGVQRMLDVVNGQDAALEGDFQRVLNSPIRPAPPGTKLLPAPLNDIATGEQQVAGVRPGGAYSAEDRGGQVQVLGPTGYAGGLSRTTGQNWQVRTLGEQFLSGGAHPELSGRLTNPGVLRTADLGAARSTLAQLESIASNPEQMAGFSATEQRGIINQIGRLRGIVQAADAPGMPRTLADIQVSGKPIADAIRNEITPAMRKTRPEAVKALSEEASRWEQNFSLRELEAERHRLNAELNPYYSKSELQQAVLDAKEKASLLANKVAVDSIRHDVTYPTLEKFSGVDLTPLKLRQSNLATIREQLIPKVNQAANELAIGRGSPFYSRAHVGTYASPRGGHAYVGGVADMVSAPEVRRANAVRRAVSKALEQRPGRAGAVAAVGTANQPQEGED